MKWNEIDNAKPKYNEPVLCLLESGAQTTASLDENNTDWVLHDHKVIDEKVIAWKELEDLNTILMQLI